jgi:hypothetical protein
MHDHHFSYIKKIEKKNLTCHTHEKTRTHTHTQMNKIGTNSPLTLNYIPTAKQILQKKKNKKISNKINLDIVIKQLPIS